MTDVGASQVKHAFKGRLFKTPTFCHVCNGFILGLGQKGLRCAECYLTIHKGCEAKVDTFCIDKTVTDLVPEKEEQKWLNIEKNNDLSDYYSKGSPWDAYEKLSELGRGGGGVVYRVRHKKDSSEWALKELPKDSYDLYLLEREILVMKDLHHPGLVDLKEAFQDAENIYLVLEIVSGGELFDRIIEQEYFSEADASSIAKQLLAALDYMHSRGCAHRDIKAENILLKAKDSTVVKIADFGLSNSLGEATKFQSCVGTTDYMAPEMLEGIRYGFGVDVWSVGVLTYIMLCGYPPFYAKTENQRVEKILAGKFSFDDEVWDSVSESARNFICHLLVQQPQARYTAKQALQHPWVTGRALEQQSSRQLSSVSNLKGYVETTSAEKAAAPAAAAAASVAAAAADPKASKKAAKAAARKEKKAEKKGEKKAKKDKDKSSKKEKKSGGGATGGE